MRHFVQQKLRLQDFAVKDLEWETVFALHAADGNIPSVLATELAAEIDEERRLFYVALTRAKSHLHVLHPNATTSTITARATNIRTRSGRGSSPTNCCCGSSR